MVLCVLPTFRSGSWWRSGDFFSPRNSGKSLRGFSAGAAALDGGCEDDAVAASPGGAQIPRPAGGAAR